MLALWPFFLQWKQSPSLIHLTLSVGVSLEREIVSISIVLGSWVVRGVWMVKGNCPPFKARIRIFWAWNTLACSIHLATVVGIEDIERIMVASCWSSPRENWSMRVTLSEIPALYTVTPKSVTITNLKPGREAPRNHPWEFHFTLVGPNRVQPLGYKPIPGSCDSAQRSSRYDSFKTAIPL